MKKCVKVVFRAVAWIFAFAVLAILALPLWIGPAVTWGVETFVPKATLTPCKLGEFGLNQYSGRLRVGGFELWNPERFYTKSESKAQNPLDVKGDGVLGAVVSQAANAASAVGDAARAVGDVVSSSETNAVRLGALDVKLAPLSVFSDTIHIEEILIEDLYVYGDLTFANLREIGKNASGGDDAKAKGEKKEKQDAGKDKGGEGKKVVIDRVLVTGAKIQWGRAAVPLPDIEIKDIGKRDGKNDDGASAEDAAGAILDGICDAADSVCKGAGAALKLAIDGVDTVGGAIGDAAGALGGAAKDAGGAIGGAAKDAAGVLGDAAKGAGGAIKDAVKGLGDAAKGIFGK